MKSWIHAIARRAALAGWLVMASAAGAAVAADWPAWRGPARTAHCEETGLATRWPEGGPPRLWRATGLGEGFATPSVAGKLLITMGNRDGQEWVIALDTSRQGQVAWATAIGKIRHGGGGYPGPRSTPTIEAGRVYALGLNGDLVALDLKTGRGLWRVDLVGQFGGRIPNWGYSESPLVDGPWILCTPGGPQATIVALLKANGRPVWAAPIGDGAGYSSIMPLDIDRTRQYVQFTAKGLVGVNGRDGTPLWRYDAPANGTANISTPIVEGTNVLAASGYGTGGGQVAVGRTGAQWNAVQTYFTKELKNHHGGMVLVDGYLYGSDDPGILRCVNWKTGETVWSDRGPGKCSLVYVEGRLVCRSERGQVSLVRATPDGYTLDGQFSEPEPSDRPQWPHPVVSGGLLFLRDQDALDCYDLRGAK